jgi:glucan phosphoethanolaminetransferase (alkaline phosphatase superfamily)
MCLDSPGHKGSKLKLSGALGRWRRPVSIFQYVDWVASLAMVVSLAVIFAIVNVRLRLSLLRREAKQLSEDMLRLTMWAEERRFSQLESATKKDKQTQGAA